MASFEHPSFTFDGDKIVRKTDAPAQSDGGEEEEVLAELAKFVESKLKNEMGFESIPIPDDDSVDIPQTTILASADWRTKPKLLLILQNQSRSCMGLFSRSTALTEGLSRGSMLPYIERAVSDGYAVLILRPNTNSVADEVDRLTGLALKKRAIVGSESPEVHVLYVMENIVSHAEANHIALLGYGNGASLCKDILLREIVRIKDGAGENRIKAFIAIEASHIVEEDDASDVKDFIKNVAVNLECNSGPRGYRLAYRQKKLGCVSISLGLPPGQSDVQNVAASIPLALDPVFSYLNIAESSATVSRNFSIAMARENGFDPRVAELTRNPMLGPAETPSVGSPSMRSTSSMRSRDESKSFFGRMFRRESTSVADTSPSTRLRQLGDDGERLTVDDFDLLKVVGKGAFGKVMLVRKKSGVGAEQIYAMKVLKKSVVVAKGQVEHTKSERAILCEIRHPYIVRLRFAFQNEEKLYLVTDYYNGGSLFYHLRKAKTFDEDRARFYSAELLSALDHLHQQHIIYRDLKLENILMDHRGHIALTDFGLSKQDIDKTGGATTFCGTAEYIAPELLKGAKYGSAVDWWSFGVLLFEMLHGRTPFYDKNRKLMFYRIIHTEPTFPSNFSVAARECLTGLLRVAEEDRLGSGENGARDIMNSRFYRSIDFDALLAQELPPPFVPDVKNEFDTKYVPKAYLKAEAKDSFAEAPKKGEDGQNFEAFTFQGDSNFDFDAVVPK